MYGSRIQRFIGTRTAGAAVLAALALTLIAATPRAAADVLYVPGEYPTIQAAIDAATDGDEIVVAPGTYMEAIDFLGKTITVRSAEGPDVTTIDASKVDGGASVVTFATAEGPDTVLDGFTITGGTGTSSGDVFFGGGIYCHGSSPTIVDCVLHKNSATQGGGVFISGGSVTLTSVLFKQNLGGFGAGLRIQGGGHAAVLDCTFIDNSSTTCGGGISNVSSAVVVDSIFDGNFGPFGGAIYASGTSLDVTASIFRNNSASTGGALFISPFYWGSISIGSSYFCNNAPGHVQSGPWTNAGGNEFHDECPARPGIPGDLDGDGKVGVPDLLLLLAAWGPCAACGDCAADLTGDCIVGVADLLILLANWS